MATQAIEIKSLGCENSMVVQLIQVIGSTRLEMEQIMALKLVGETKNYNYILTILKILELLMMVMLVRFILKL